MIRYAILNFFGGRELISYKRRNLDIIKNYYVASKFYKVRVIIPLKNDPVIDIEEYQPRASAIYLFNAEDDEAAKLIYEVGGYN